MTPGAPTAVTVCFLPLPVVRTPSRRAGKAERETAERTRRLPRRHRRYIAHYLVAQVEALVADPVLTSRCHGRDAVPAFAAQAALFRAGVLRAARLNVLGNYRVRAAYAFVADMRVRPADHYRDLLPALFAE
jgi:hypothetical protein